ncbi:hypothetical protein BH20ACT3_BH20ACT3_18280 [soil metagenome]
MQPLSPSPDTTDVAGPTSAEVTPAALERELETYRRQLTGYCYRMLGSGFEADDAVQENMVRAWRSIGGFEGRSSLRSWLYRIATNVATLSSRDLTAAGEDPTDPEIRALLDRYVDAFERYDMGALVALLHDDATLSMPPFALWLQGADQLIEWFVGHGSVCEGSRLVATAANGTAAFGSYHRAEGGGHEPFGLQVLEISGGRITGHHNFLGPDLFEAFGLPLRLER